jgi:hypothetical protein
VANILLILCVYAISKKCLKTKRKTLFDLRFFYLSRGEEKREKAREEKQRKNNTLNRINSNLPGESIARETCLRACLSEYARRQADTHRQRKSIVFVKQGEITPLLQKTIPETEKRKEKHNTQKIIKI